ncbi:unnamed protein product, partial [Adineta steineri]
STFLPSSIFSNLKTEEELLDHLGSSAATSDANEQRESEHEIDQEDSQDEEHQMSDEADDIDGSNDLEGKMALRNNRQKRQADEFPKNTNKKQKLTNINIGDNVLRFL